MQAVHFAQNWMLTLSFIDLTYRCHRVVTVGLCVFQKSTFCLKDIQVRAVWQFGEATAVLAMCYLFEQRVALLQLSLSQHT